MSDSTAYIKPQNEVQIFDYVAYATVSAKGITIGDKLQLKVTRAPDGTETSEWFNLHTNTPTLPLPAAPNVGQVGDATTEAIPAQPFRKTMAYTKDPEKVNDAVIDLSPGSLVTVPGNFVIEEGEKSANLIELRVQANGDDAIVQDNGNNPVQNPNPSGTELNGGGSMEIEGRDEVFSAKALALNTGETAFVSVTYIYVHEGWND